VTSSAPNCTAFTARDDVSSTSRVPNFLEVAEKNTESLIYVLKYGYHWADLHETLAFKTFLKEFLYQVAWKSDTLFSPWY